MDTWIKLRIGASRLGIPIKEYAQHVANGLKWCGGSKHWVPNANFSRCRRRGDGLSPWCRDCLRERGKRNAYAQTRESFAAEVREILDGGRQNEN